MKAKAVHYQKYFNDTRSHCERVSLSVGRSSIYPRKVTCQHCKRLIAKEAQ